VNSTDPRARLLELVATHGVSLSGLSALIGRNPTYLQQFVRKGSPRKLEENDRGTLARFFGVSESELGGAAESETALAPHSPLRRAAGEWVDVPRLGLGASAGTGTLDASEVAVGQLRFSSAWLRRQGLEAAMLSAIEVEGDSMEPVLRDGDEILVDRTHRPLRAGIHVLRLDDVLLVKRIEPAGAERLRVISDNPAYAPLERARSEVEIVGRVVWKGGRL
jgi:phage repressor protein C with HTH and peptisase S24 domain